MNKNTDLKTNNNFKWYKLTKLDQLVEKKTVKNDKFKSFYINKYFHKLN